MTYWAHETAVVDDGAEIGEGTKIWHFAHILPDTTVGRNCSLGQNVMAGPGVTIGDKVKVQNNVSLYKGVHLEDGVFCGPSCVFTNVLTPRGFVERKSEFGETIVRRGATIGANSTIVCGDPNGRTELGEYCFIAAGAVVTKDVPAFALMAGVPARRIGWVSRAGEVLGKDLKCPRTGERYEERDGTLVIVDEVAQDSPHLED
ncbi:acyltransferase [Hyphobacterium indicum]|uniref:acyltransferase n=1 Tax=Hyphobacterium indicum TaxID=2162714 RepID=UPI000D6435AD|nr:acyltransferase [Hyphobacterium indicum]